VGQDLRRAALLTVALGSLLLAASLMPAAGLGSFPSAESDAGGDSGPAASTGTATETATETATLTETATPTETTTPTVTRTETDAPAGDSPDRSDGSGSVFTELFTLFSLLTFGVVGSALAAAGYAGTVLAVSTVAGPAVAERLPFGAGIRSLPTATMATLIGLSGSLSRFFRSVGSGTDALVAGLSGLTGAIGSIGVGLTAVLSRSVSLGSGLSAGVGSLFGSLSNALSSLTRGGATRTTAGTTEAASADARSAVGVDPEPPSEPDEPATVSEAWERMTDRIPVSDKFAKTPAELRDAAIERDWPRDPVERLTAIFREIRYGSSDRTDEHTETALSALAELRSYWEDDQ